MRAENILVSHLACGGTAGVIRIRVRGGELVGLLVLTSDPEGALATKRA